MNLFSDIPEDIIILGLKMVDQILSEPRKFIKIEREHLDKMKPIQDEVKLIHKT